MSKVLRIKNPRVTKELPMKLYETLTMNADGDSMNVKYTIISGDETISRFDSFCPENPYSMNEAASQKGGTADWDWEEFLSPDEGRIEAREKAFFDYMKRSAEGREQQITLIGEWTEPKQRSKKHQFRNL